MLQTLTRHGQHSLAMELATKVAEPSWVSHFCACIGSPCLRQCVHGAPIGAHGHLESKCWHAVGGVMYLFVVVLVSGMTDSAPLAPKS